MYAEVAWALVSSGTQVQPQIILSPDYLPDYLSVSYDYGSTNPITSIFFFFRFLHATGIIPSTCLLLVA